MPARAVGARARGLPMGTRDKWCADAGRARTDCSGRGAGMGLMILMRADPPAGAGIWPAGIAHKMPAIVIVLELELNTYIYIVLASKDYKNRPAVK